MVKTGNATAIRWRLLGEGMIVRDCTSFGLPDFIRIGVRTRGECERLVAALSGIMEAAHVDG
jgi:histidinol-phosphate aminotransferase